MVSSLGGGVGGDGAGMEVPLVSDSEMVGERGPIWKDSADLPMRGTDLRLICGPDLELMLYRCPGNICGRTNNGVMLNCWGFSPCPCQSEMG